MDLRGPLGCPKGPVPNAKGTSPNPQGRATDPTQRGAKGQTKGKALEAESPQPQEAQRPRTSKNKKQVCESDFLFFPGFKHHRAPPQPRENPEGFKAQGEGPAPNKRGTARSPGRKRAPKGRAAALIVCLRCLFFFQDLPPPEEQRIQWICVPVAGGGGATSG